jgi:hypothetical protein
MHEIHLHAGNRDYSPHQLPVRHFSSHKLETNCNTDFGIVWASITAQPPTYDSNLYTLRVAPSPPTFCCSALGSLHRTSAITSTYRSSWSSLFPQVSDQTPGMVQLSSGFRLHPVLYHIAAQKRQSIRTPLEKRNWCCRLHRRIRLWDSQLHYHFLLLGHPTAPRHRTS